LEFVIYYLPVISYGYKKTYRTNKIPFEGPLSTGTDTGTPALRISPSIRVSPHVEGYIKPQEQSGTPLFIAHVDRNTPCIISRTYRQLQTSKTVNKNQQGLPPVHILYRKYPWIYT